MLTHRYFIGKWKPEEWPAPPAQSSLTSNTSNSCKPLPLSSQAPNLSTIRQSTNTSTTREARMPHFLSAQLPSNWPSRVPHKISERLTPSTLNTLNRLSRSLLAVSKSFNGTNQRALSIRIQALSKSKSLFLRSWWGLQVDTNPRLPRRPTTSLQSITSGRFSRARRTSMRPSDVCNSSRRRDLLLGPSLATGSTNPKILQRSKTLLGQRYARSLVPPSLIVSHTISQPRVPRRPASLNKSAPTRLIAVSMAISRSLCLAQPSLLITKATPTVPSWDALVVKSAQLDFSAKMVLRHMDKKNMTTRPLAHQTEIALTWMPDRAPKTRRLTLSDKPTAYLNLLRRTSSSNIWRQNNLLIKICGIKTDSNNRMHPMQLTVIESSSHRFPS